MEDLNKVKQEFAEKYMYNIKANVLPVVKKFEIERKIRFILALIIAIIVTIAAVSIFIFLLLSIKHGGRALIFKLSVWIFGFAAIAWFKIQKPFEYKIKQEIMPILISSFDGFKWEEIADDEYYESVLNSDIFTFFPNKKIDYALIDYFYGNYNNVHIDFSEAIYSTKAFCNKFEYFGGMIRIKMNKNFEGVTVLRPKKALYQDLKDMGMEEIILEDTDFNNKFAVYSTNQVEARYLLTPTFMEKLKNISINFNDTDKIYCAFNDKYIYIAPESKKTIFSLFGLSKRVDNIKEFHRLFTQIASVIDLINYLKLDVKLGL